MDDIDTHDFDEMIATKKESAPGLHGFPYGLYRCAVDWVHTSCSMLTDLWRNTALSPHILLRAGPCSFPNLQLSMTLVSS